MEQIIHKAVEHWVLMDVNNAGGEIRIGGNGFSFNIRSKETSYAIIFFVESFSI
ncbi:MAG: hypothetical protein MI974_21145 [Chitinophagales bacterium]|nr:hypothetical protein [Chitinophagales bacterium]